MVVSREGWYQLAYMLQVWETTASGYATTSSLYEGEVTTLEGTSSDRGLLNLLKHEKGHIGV